MINIIEKKIQQEWKNLIFNFIFAALTLLFAILFYKRIIIAFLLIGIVSIVGLVKWKSKLTLFVFIMMALLGIASEIIMFNQEVWNLLLTVWLMLIWGNAGAFIYQSALEFKKMGIKK